MIRDTIPSLTVREGQKPHNQHKYAVCEVFFIEKYVAIFLFS